MRFNFIIILFFLYMISIPSIYADDEFCKKELNIVFIPFYLENQEMDYLKKGIPKMMYSYIKNKFFLSTKTLPILTLNNKILKTNQKCLPYAIAHIELNTQEDTKINNTNNLVNELYNICIKNNWDAIISGFINVQEKNIKVTTVYVNAYNKKDFILKEFIINKDEPYKEEIYKNITNEIFLEINKSNTKKIQIQSSLTNYRVYINDLSYGLNLREIYLPDGNFVITIYHENCKKNYTTDQIQNKIYFECEEDIKKQISIESHPSNADVYMDEKYMGKTPITLQLQEKIYRLRLSLEGYVDKNVVINLKNNKNNNYVFTLLKGDNKEYYYNNNIISNWTYYDLSFGMGIQSLIFAMGWAYANIQKEKVLDSIRSPLIPLYNLNPLELNIIQLYVIENTRKKSLRWHRIGQTYGGLSILSIFSSIYFFYKGIQLDLERGYEYGNNFHFKVYFRFPY